MSDLPWNLAYFREIDGPEIPVALPATAEDAGTFTANWAPSARAESYLLDVSTDPEFGSFVAGYHDLEVADLSSVVLGVSGLNYYRIRAQNPYGTSGYSNVIQALADFIEAPVATAATNVEEDRFTANWEAVIDPELDGYMVEVSETEDFEELVPLGVPLDAGVALSLVITGLAPETEYFYRVRARKDNGVESDPSNVITTETEPLFVGEGGDEVKYFPELGETVHIYNTVGSAPFYVRAGSKALKRRLVVGGGAQGGGVNGSGVSCAGGGGGEVLDLDDTDRPDQLVVGEYEVIVGKGGDTPGALNVGENGGDSSFDGDTAKGGGRGGGAGNNPGNGGSGGGAANSSGGPELGGVTTKSADGLGTDGGDANAGAGGGGGGGGAAEPGENGSNVKGGDGGDGYECDITGENERYGAGGAGARPVDAFGVIAGTAAGAPGAGGGGAGANATPANGGAATGVGAGGGGALGNRSGGVGKKGRVAVRYKGRGVDAVSDDEDVPAPVYVGPITFAGCTRLQEVGAVDILVDCNARIDSGIFPDYQRYLCLGGGVVKSSRSMRSAVLPSELPDNALPGGENGIQNGTLVFRFSVPIKAFKITRRVTSGAVVPIILACDDYTVVPHPTSVIPGSSKDGSIINIKKQFPEYVYYPAFGYSPPQNMAAEEVMEITYAPGFSCIVILQGNFPSEFIDPYFSVL